MHARDYQEMFLQRPGQDINMKCTSSLCSVSVHETLACDADILCLDAAASIWDYYMRYCADSPNDRDWR